MFGPQFVVFEAVIMLSSCLWLLFQNVLCAPIVLEYCVVSSDFSV